MKEELTVFIITFSWFILALSISIGVAYLLINWKVKSEEKRNKKYLNRLCKMNKCKWSDESFCVNKRICENCLAIKCLERDK